MTSRLEALVPLPIRRAVRRVVGAPRPRVRPLRRAPESATDALACCVAYNELGGYCVPLRSVARPSAQRIMRGEVWEPETLALIGRHADDGDVVHAGTYFGDFLPFLSRAVGERGRVWAFEPNPENHRCAQITVLLNDLANVTLHHAGLGSARGTAQLAVADAEGTPLGGGSRFRAGSAPDEHPADGHAADEEVAIDTIDRVVPADRRVAVIQLDVEGFEQTALEGGLETIERCRPLLVVERRLDPAWLAQHLAPLGYTVVGRSNANSVLRVDE